MSLVAWIQSLVRERPDLYRTIYDWNCYPHRWVAADRLPAPAAPTPVISLLEQTPAGRARLSRHFRQQLALMEDFWDFRDARRRLALLSPTSLRQLARTVGAAMHAPRLARIIAKEQRRVVTERLGAAAYGFALRHGLAHAESTSPIAAPFDAWLEQVEQDGWISVRSVLQHEPTPVTQRLRLKFPANLPCEATALQPADTAWSRLQPALAASLTPEELQCLA